MNPSPRAHVYRMLAALVIFVAIFIGIRALAMPDSWDSERWFRQDSLNDIKQLPMHYGGNESCEAAGCHHPEQAAEHGNKLASLSSGKHQGLACEVCHGPFSAHIEDGKKVNNATVTVSNELCLSCHRQLMSRPDHFAQFSNDQIRHKLLNVREISLCRACHDPHEPTG